jgi:hypothetical protein
MNNHFTYVLFHSIYIFLFLQVMRKGKKKPKGRSFFLTKEGDEV